MASAGVAQSTASGEPEFTVVPEGFEFRPGEVGKYSFSLINDGYVDDTSGSAEFDQQMTTATRVTYEIGETDAPVYLKDGETSVGTVPETRIGDLGFQVSVWDNASAGRYEVPITFEYRYKDTITYDDSSGQPVATDFSYETEEETFDIILEVEETGDFEVVDSDFTGSVGDSGVLSLDVENTGNGSVSDASFSVESANPSLSFSGSQSAERYIGDWGEDEVKSIDLRASVAPNALSGDLSARATVNFVNDGYPESDSFSFPVSTEGEDKISLEEVEADLLQGEDTRITGKVVNRGSRTLENLQLSFNPRDQYVTATQPTYAVGDLEPGEEKTFSFPVEVSGDAETGPRIYSVEAQYRNPEGGSRATTSVDFDSSITDSEGDFVVEEVNSTVTRGSSTTYMVEVTNPTNSTYRNVDAKAFASDPISVDDDRAFASVLPPGETREFSFRVSASGSSMLKEYPVRMDFRYEENGDSRLSDTYRTSLQVEQPESSGSSLPFIVAGLVLLIGAGASYYTGRPEKLWNRV
jgi:hypothetical protein